jgi:hypothetical protein
MNILAPREIPATFTPRTLARFIATLIREDERWLNQESWTGTAFLHVPAEHIRVRLTRNEWSTSSTACIGGWAAILTLPNDAIILSGADRIRMPDGTLTSVLDHAQHALDLTYSRACWLFNWARTEAQVLAALDAIAETGTFEIPSLLEPSW